MPTMRPCWRLFRGKKWQCWHRAQFIDTIFGPMVKQKKRTTMARKPDEQNRSKGRKTRKDGLSHASKECKLTVLYVYSLH